jgi:SHAQKYF class myb-like DNA-binding protein
MVTSQEKAPSEFNTGKWSSEEERVFLAALQVCGRSDMVGIQRHVQTRELSQVRSHTQSYFGRLAKQQAGTSDDGNTVPVKRKAESTLKAGDTPKKPKKASQAAIAASPGRPKKMISSSAKPKIQPSTAAGIHAEHITSGVPKSPKKNGNEVSVPPPSGSMFLSTKTTKTKSLSDAKPPAISPKTKHTTAVADPVPAPLDETEPEHVIHKFFSSIVDVIKEADDLLTGAALTILTVSFVILIVNHVFPTLQRELSDLRWDEKLGFLLRR